MLMTRRVLRLSATARVLASKHALAIPSERCKSIVLGIESAIGKSVDGSEEIVSVSVKSPSLFLLRTGDCREMHSDEPSDDLVGSDAVDLFFLCCLSHVPFHADIYPCKMISQVHESSAKLCLLFAIMHAAQIFARDAQQGF